MPISARSYGSVAGVASLTKHATTGGTFDGTTKPTLTDVEAFIDQRSALLNSKLTAAGHTVPIANADAVQALAFFVNNGAAADVEKAQRSGGYGDGTDDTRESMFLREWEKHEAFIASGALGAPEATPTPYDGFKVGGRTSTGDYLTPLFKRSQRPRDVDGDQVLR